MVLHRLPRLSLDFEHVLRFPCAFLLHFQHTREESPLEEQSRFAHVQTAANNVGFCGLLALMSWRERVSFGCDLGFDLRVDSTCTGLDLVELPAEGIHIQK